MGARGGHERRGGATAPVDEGPHAVDVVHLPGDENLQVIGEADQPAVDQWDAAEWYIGKRTA